MPMINVSKMVLARQYRGLSQRELSTLTGVTQAALSRIEKNELSPSEATQANIISALGFPESFFYETQNTTATTLSFHAFRKKASVSAAKVNKIHAELSIKSQHQDMIHGALPIEPPQKIPESINSPDALAQYLRESWNVGENPIENLTQHVEAMGIDIFLCNFLDVQVDGVTATTDQGRKAIYLNINQPADRYRFSLAHELCHYLLHAGEICATPEMEDEANRFASLLLMPESSLKDSLRTTRLRDFAQLKQVWKVSMAALIYRAKQLEAISTAQATSLYQQMSMHGFRKVEPYPFAAEQPQRMYKFLIDFADTKQSLPAALHVSTEDFEQLYPNFYVAQEMPVT